MRLLQVGPLRLAFFSLILCLIIGPSANAYDGRLNAGTWQRAWTQGLTASLGESRLLAHQEKQIENLCPGYAAAPPKRLVFWQQLMITLAWKESLYGPANYIRYNGGINQGLYQIDPRVRKYYGCSGYDLYDPLDNIDCAVKMANHLVARDGTFLGSKKQGMAAYWQPLRATSKRNIKDRKFILSDVAQACRTGALVYHSSRGFLDDVSGEINGLEELGIDAVDLEP